ncbi:hypothetical protein EMIHUDRAFT_198419 [Emiliania huxleyi CCMP1516]|uniref:Uncharacterized protein n=2 Tax=Emiliania huxleyi TaxID=2903 RepID=A0A0D3I783_EMIH1|nr:hypothetical protein EMIHUDRAFT_198419 [Emiliania huxleyi CCMP1516]EOD07118.1 hypothetical protein EMIHUDRAFT_198419 [Emiliania huxleyi CCMP1516]|eukprot:XP_005759547.1 hypothetical protein EMIHUDRAFT_198419 [Emiliania huxleyi CCMP1516]
MAAVAIAATVVQSYSAQAPLVCRLLSHFAHARAARPASLREGMSLPRFDPAAKSCSLEPRPTLPSRPQLLSSPEDWCLICCLPADAAGEPGGIRGILWVVQSIDLWRVSQLHFEGAMKYSDRHLAGLSARPPDRVELIGAGSLGYTGPAPASAEG